MVWVRPRSSRYGPERDASSTPLALGPASCGRETLGLALGRALYSSGVEALVAPSARVPEANNLVVFPPNLLSTSKQEILEEAELKAWLKQ